MISKPWKHLVQNISGIQYYRFYQFPKHTFKTNKVKALRIPKLYVPITPPRNQLAAQVEKKNQCGLVYEPELIVQSVKASKEFVLSSNF